MLSFVLKNYINLFIMLGMCLLLFRKREEKNIHFRYFKMVVIFCLLLSIEDSLELYTAGRPDLKTCRIFLSVLGYVLRPMAAHGLIMVLEPANKLKRTLWIPEIINAAIMLTAFFSPIAFSYNANYSFVRGPLGYSVFIVSFFYIFLLLYMTYRRFRDGRRMDNGILLLCVLACIAASLIETSYFAYLLVPSVLVSCVFFYIFLNSQVTDKDALTDLYNRQSFYNDCLRYEKSITAVASVDMNGLKTINDTRGHLAGDEALRCIGKTLREAMAWNVLSYRVGGDEFMVLFVNAPDHMIRHSILRIGEDILKSGYSAAIGCAYRGNGEDIEELIRLSDEEMYHNKAAFYKQKEQV